MTDSPAPRRRRRLAVPIVFAGIALTAAAVLIPESPVHVSTWLPGPPDHEGRTASQWEAALAHPDAAERKRAAHALGCLNVHAIDSLPRLTEVLHSDTDPDVRIAAAASLGKMHPATKAVLPDLAGGLTDPERGVRMYCLIALNRLGVDARPVLPAILAAATDEDNDARTGMFLITVRENALRTLGTVAEGTPDAVPTLTAVLEQPAPEDTRLIAVQGLGLAGPHAAAAAPLVRSFLRDPNPEVRTAAEEALVRIGVSRDGPTVTDEFADLQLPEAEQKRLWTFEHAGNALNAYGFESLAAALRAADRGALASHLAPEFAGSDLAEPTRVAVTGVADVVRFQDSGRPAKPLTPVECVNRLLELRAEFAAPPKVKLVVATVHPKNESDLDGLWEGKALLRMVGESTSGGPAEVTATLLYAVARPTEARLAKDGWLHRLDVKQVAVAKSARPLFVERAAARGLKTDLHDNWTADATNVVTGGVFVTDFNRDGYLDVLVTDVTGNNLYRGGPDGRFTDVTDELGAPRANGGGITACWVDLDGDGWDDLIVGPRVFRNDGGAKLVDYTERCRIDLPLDASNYLVADYDRDGKLDLYVARSGAPGTLSWLQDRSSDPIGNRLFRNLGGWRFEDVTKKSGTRGGYRSAFTAAWLDANNDGWPDVHVPNEFGDGVLLVNNGDGTFREQRLADRPADFGTMGLAAGDLDNDGNIDLYCADMYSKAGTRVIGNLKPDAYPPQVMEKFRRFVAGSQIHRNAGGLKFEQVGVEKQVAAVGWAYGPALADLDADGFLDVYATAGYISRDRDKPDG